MFTITAGKGFQITFANGWTASIQFGKGNYCENRYNNQAELAEVSSFDGSYVYLYNGDINCIDAEVWGINDTSGERYGEIQPYDEEKDEYGEVYRGIAEKNVEPIGWLNPEEVLQFINEVANLPKREVII